MRNSTLLPLMLVAGSAPSAVAAPGAEPPAASSTASGPAAPAAPPPALYSLPWQLRPAAAATVLRSDTSAAFYDDPKNGSGNTMASMLLGSYRLTPHLAPLVRIGFVSSSAIGMAAAGQALVNPVVGGTYLLGVAPELRVALFLAVAIPVGQGGGNTPEAATAAAAKAGIYARSAMDNAMFAINDLTVFPGVDVAWVRGRLTLQAEATLLELTRVRGEAVQKDARRTNLTSGLHAGFFAFPWLSIGAELRYQRWLSTPAAVDANPDLRDTVTAAIGPRAHMKLRATWLRPGISYSRGLDSPMSGQSYHILQVDLPVSF